MSTLDRTTMHPRYHFKEWRFNGANMSKHKCACIYHRYMLKPNWMFMDCIRNQTYQCAKYKLKIVYKTWQQKHGEHSFKQEKQFFVLPFSSTCEDLSIDVSITNVGLIWTKLKWFLFSGCGQTDTVLESSYGNMSCSSAAAHKKFHVKTQNLELGSIIKFKDWRGIFPLLWILQNNKMRR